MKRMYTERSNVLHNGELKKDVKFSELQDLENFLSICIRVFLFLSKKYDKKRKIITEIEKGFFGQKIEFPSNDELYLK